MGVNFYMDNWLTASAGVGLIQVLKEFDKDYDLGKGRKIEISEKEFKELPELFAEYLVKDCEEILTEKFKELLRKKKFSLEDIKNPYNYVILPKLGDFYNNSKLTNQSAKYIKKVDELSKNLLKKTFDGLKEEEIKEKFWERLKEVNYLGVIKDAIKKAVLEGIDEILKNKEDPNAPLCFFCRERHTYVYKGKYRVFGAEHFTPLSASEDTIPNLFWNGKNEMYLCSYCEFYLFFAFAGFTKVGKNRFLFVYIPDDVETLLSVNSHLKTKERVEKSILGELFRAVKFLKNLEEQKSRWILENIYFVEIEKVSEAKANIYSFSVSPKLAKVLRDYLDDYPEIFDSIFPQFVEYAYAGRSLYEFLHKILSGYFFKKSFKDLKGGYEEALIKKGASFDFLPYKLTYFIKFQEALSMGRDFEKQIRFAYFEGLNLKKEYEENLGKDKAEKRIQSLSYRILESVRRKDIDAFQQNLIRAYMQVEREIPYIFVEALKDENFNRIVYAFLIGLNGRERLEGEGEGTSEESVGEG